MSSYEFSDYLFSLCLKTPTLCAWAAWCCWILFLFHLSIFISEWIALNLSNIHFVIAGMSLCYLSKAWKCLGFRISWVLFLNQRRLDRKMFILHLDLYRFWLWPWSLRDYLTFSYGYPCLISVFGGVGASIRSFPPVGSFCAYNSHRPIAGDLRR